MAAPEHDLTPPPFFVCALWMAGVGLVLSLLPIVGAFVGGLAGGYLAQSPRRALPAAAMGIVCHALVFRFVPYSRVLNTGSEALLLTHLLAALSMLLGALLGGAFGRQKVMKSST